MTRFAERVERDLGQIADRATPSSTAWEAIQQRIAEQDTNRTSESTTEVIMLAPDRNDTPNRTRNWILVAAAIAVLALIGGLIVAGTRADEDPVPVDEPEPEVEDGATEPLPPDPRTPAEIEADTALAEAALVTVDEIGGGMREAPAGDNPEGVALRQNLLACFGGGGGFGPAQAGTGEFTPPVNAFNEYLAQTVGVLPDTTAAVDLIAGATTPEVGECLTDAYTAGIAGAIGTRRNADVVLTGTATFTEIDETDLWWADLAEGDATIVEVRIPIDLDDGGYVGNAVTEFALIQEGRAVTALEWSGDDGRGTAWDPELAASKLAAVVEAEGEPDSAAPEVEAAPTFPVGANPDAIVFDGTSIWVNNIGDSTVSKINPDDGTRVDYETGTFPDDIVFDGTNIWIVNLQSTSVTKMNPDDGTRTDYEAGGNPVALGWDGTSIWVGNCADSTVSKMNPDDGTRIDYPVGSCPQGIAFDGTSIWVANFEGDTVSKVNPDDGTRIDYETGTAPWDVAFDGTSIWVTNSEAGTVSKINPDDGTRVDYPSGNQPYEITFDGTSIWVTNRVDATVSQFDIDDGSRVDYPTGNIPRGVASDGTSIWVANGTDGTVSKITPG